MSQPKLYAEVLAEITMDLLYDQVLAQDDLDCQFDSESRE